MSGLLQQSVDVGLEKSRFVDVALIGSARNKFG